MKYISKQGIINIIIGNKIDAVFDGVGYGKFANDKHIIDTYKENIKSYKKQNIKYTQQLDIFYLYIQLHDIFIPHMTTKNELEMLLQLISPIDNSFQPSLYIKYILNKDPKKNHIDQHTTYSTIFTQQKFKYVLFLHDK